MSSCRPDNKSIVDRTSTCRRSFIVFLKSIYIFLCVLTRVHSGRLSLFVFKSKSKAVPRPNLFAPPCIFLASPSPAFPPCFSPRYPNTVLLAGLSSILPFLLCSPLFLGCSVFRFENFENVACDYVSNAFISNSDFI